MSQSKTVLAVLIYARRQSFEGEEFLMVHRNSGRVGDIHEGKWNGLGGKCEGTESFFESAQREFLEEAGVNIDYDRFIPLGFLQFPNFKPHKNEDWVCMVFDLELHSGEVAQVKMKECPEGELAWIQSERILDLPLWEGDLKFLPHVQRREKFFGTFWYEQGKLARFDLRG